MSRDDLAELALAVLLTALAGFVDAVGFLHLGHLFVSFMSGNSTQLAVAAERGRTDDFAKAAILIASYVLGTMGGRLVTRVSEPAGRPRVLALEAALLVGALVAPGLAAAGLMAFAMGVQNAVVHRAAGAKMTLTYVTGTLVSFGEKLMDAILGYEKPFAFAPHLALWVGLVIGAAAGGWSYEQAALAALAVPAAALAALAGATALRAR